MDHTPDQARRLESLIRTGTVEEIDGGQVRIRSGGILSDWRPWPGKSAGKVKEWVPPVIGEQVALLSPSGETGNALLLTGIFSEANASPSTDGETHLRTYAGGAAIGFNMQTGALTASGITSASIQASDSCSIDCPEVSTTGNLTVGGTLTVTGAATLSDALTVQGLATFNGGTLGDRV